MTLAIRWGKSGPVLEKPGICESCGSSFACELSLSGCWCSRVALTDNARAQLRQAYERCLCPECLKRYERV